MSSLTRFAVAMGLAVGVFASPVRAQIEGLRREVVIATATTTGNYFSIGNGLCRILQRQGLYLANGDVTLLGCGAASTSGSLQNVELLRMRDVDFALVQSDVISYAFNGSGRFAGRRVDQLRSLLSLNQEAFQVLAGRGTNVAIWHDLKGKKVNLGPVGTTGHSLFRDLFAIHGVDDKWLAQSLTIPVNIHTQELCDGNVEVIGQTTGVPNGGLAAAARRCGARLVALDTPQIRQYVADRAFFTPVLVPRNTYAGQVNDVRTFGVLATLMSTNDTPELAAYSIVRAVFEGLPELKAMLPVLSGLVPEKMIKDGLSAPFHAGALRYYRERGWMQEEPTPVPVSLSGTTDALAAAATLQPAPATVPAPQLPPTAPTPPQSAKGGTKGPTGRDKSQIKGRGTAGPS